MHTTNKVTDIVENILKTSHLARNSDKELLLAYWESQGLSLSYQQRELFKTLKMPESVRRIRQKFQEKGMYLADKPVKTTRDFKSMVMQQNMPTAKPQAVERLLDTTLIEQATLL